MHFILKRLGTKLKKLKPRPVKVGIQYTVVDRELGFLLTLQSKKDMLPAVSVSEVSFTLTCIELLYSKNFGKI